ncbi:VOC family protein [Millisia brevis]|uniref:VOC family protein n=1 Tax=Millisia brevis TaxID=264148 RepID=UPI000829F5AE|nr:VOC family protein [Millisia brevis]
MTVSLSTVFVLADDPDAAVAFYSGVLGLEVTNRVENGGFTWVTLATVSQPGLSIVLTHPRAGRSAEDGEAIAALLAKGELGAINLSTDDLDKVYEKIASADGVEVLQEPMDQFWGVRDAAFRDPSGNTVRIAQA